jgi:hypothetical protein
LLLRELRIDHPFRSKSPLDPFFKFLSSPHIAMHRIAVLISGSGEYPWLKSAEMH